MPFDPLDYLPFGRSLDHPKASPPASEAALRTCCGRAYYAAYLFARERLASVGFTTPKGEQVHVWLQQRLRTAMNNNDDLRDLGRRLTAMADTRSKADYVLDNQSSFHVGSGAKALVMAEQWIRDFAKISDGTLRSDIRPG